MGEIQFTGLTTGIDTASIVKQLMDINSRRLATYQVKQKTYEEQSTLLDELKSKITALQSATKSLSDSSTMNAYNVSTSDSDKLSLSASSDASVGSHSVEVKQLSTTESWIHDTSTFNYKTDYVGGGKFIYSYNNQERVITAVEGETTLEDFVNLINKDDSNPGVTASLLYQSGKYHLMLSGQDAGEDYQISVNASSTEAWKPDTSLGNHTFTEDDTNAGLSTKIEDLDQFFGILGASDKITISGKNHSGTSLANTEIAITSNTTVGHLIDSINKHFDGVATARLENGQICLTDNISGASGLEIGLSFSGEAAINLPTMALATEGGSTLASLASISYSSFIQTQDAQSSMIRIDGYPSEVTNEVQTLSISGEKPTAGTFKLTLNGQTTAEIAYNASAADIQSALLALSGIEDGDVVCTGTNFPDGSIAVTFGGNLAGMDIANMTVSEASGLTAGAVSVIETAKGNSGWMSRNSNSISDALAGITLNINDITETDTPVKITVNRNTASISKKIQAMVSAYNELVTELKSKTEYDSSTKEMGALSKDVAVTYLKTSLKTPFSGIIKGFNDTKDSFVTASDIGITMDGAGLLEFDTAEFEEAISDNYKSVVELLGATKTGNTTNSGVQLYSSSDKYTTAGAYNVKVEVDENNKIISAKIKLAGDSAYRDAASWKDNIVYFDSTFDDDGKPLYPENGLQLTVNLEQGVYGTDENPVVVNVKQGMAGSLEDLLTQVLKTDGQIDKSSSIIDERITQIKAKIEKEQTRLERVEERLNQKYARLEKALTTMQQQMSAVSAMAT